MPIYSARDWTRVRRVRRLKVSRRRSEGAIKGHVEFDTITRASSRPVSVSSSTRPSLSPEIDARALPPALMNGSILLPSFLPFFCSLFCFACPLAASLAEWRSRLVLTRESTARLSNLFYALPLISFSSVWLHATRRRGGKAEAPTRIRDIRGTNPLRPWRGRSVPVEHTPEFAPPIERDIFPGDGFRADRGWLPYLLSFPFYYLSSFFVFHFFNA